MSVALAIVAVIALGTFGLVLILARRLKAVTERVNMFLPAMESTLPQPGTPIPEFEAVSADGERVSRDSFTGVDRILAVITTGCGSCHEQVTAFTGLGVSLDPRPVVAIIGAAEERAPMVAKLDGQAVIIEESHTGPLVEELEIHSFPAVMLVRDAVIQQAGHELPSMVASLTALAAPASAGRRQRS